MSMLDESDPIDLNDLTDVIIIDTVRSLVIQQDPWAQYISIDETETPLTGVRSYRAVFLAFNKNVNALVVLFDSITLETIATFFSICKFSEGV